eukprot:TRINITY_DN32501_c1_g1_i1.p1 TRINITY_DN32501_c1_g1~~TRINITY_DN32501_c1_g1_i1.p1  ORF type:complete len:193 (-),score=29.29 TRINITY_DN32501_c1_g1_i1:995-1573(-)
MPPAAHKNTDPAFLKVKVTGQEVQQQRSSMRKIGRGWCCCSGWSFNGWLTNLIGKSFVWPDKTNDCGFAKLYTGTMSQEDGGSAERLAEMAADHWMVAATLDAYLHGMHDNQQLAKDAYRAFVPSPCLDSLEFAKSTPVFVFQGECDKAMPQEIAQFFKGPYPHCDVEILRGHGHSTMFLEVERMMRKVLGE